MLQRIEFETSDRDEAVDAMGALVGGPITVAGTHGISLKQSAVIGDGVSDGWMRLGTGYRAVNTPDDFIHVVSTEGVYRADAGRVQHVAGGGELMRPPTHLPVHFDVPAGLVRVTGLSGALVRRFARETAQDDVELDLEAVHPVSPAMAAHWRSTMAFYRAHVLQEEVDSHDLVRAEATRLLIATTITAFRLHPTRELHANPTAAMRRARAFIDDHLHEPIVLADIAAAARLSPRTLLSAFQREHGTSPMVYLRAARLDAVRADLLTADPTKGDTVADIARRWGFAHLGRFAAHYRTAHGEPPAQTLRR